jgi:transposase InsO family protein
MRRIDELHLEHPFYGARRLAKQLEREGFDVGRVHVTTLMRRMGIEALYRRPRTSIPARDAKIYPYLLDGLAIERPNQVWSSDLTVFAHGSRIFVPRGDLRRGESQSAFSSSLEHDDAGFLRRCADRGNCPIWYA